MSLIYGTVNSVEGTYATVLPFVEPGWATGKGGRNEAAFGTPSGFFSFDRRFRAGFYGVGWRIIGCTFCEMYGTHSQAFSTLARLNRKPEGKRSGLIGSESVRLSKPRIP